MLLLLIIYILIHICNEKRKQYFSGVDILILIFWVYLWIQLKKNPKINYFKDILSAEITKIQLL